eukprot:6108935-Pyramimonas_sp.AAC.1
MAGQQEPLGEARPGTGEVGPGRVWRPNAADPHGGTRCLWRATLLYKIRQSGHAPRDDLPRTQVVHLLRHLQD